MICNCRLTVTTLVLGATLLSAGVASAGPILDWLGLCQCPRPCYSPFRYWTPTAARVHDCCHGVHLSVYPPDRHPEIPPTMFIYKYKCPPVPPADTIIPVPTPPAESRFEYFAQSSSGNRNASGNSNTGNGGQR